MKSSPGLFGLESFFLGFVVYYPVSIHALLAECDPPARRRAYTLRCFNPRTPCGVRHHFHSFYNPLVMFQSTHSLRSATLYRYCNVIDYTVSIHALLAECDSSAAADAFSVPGFNPRTPCGVRRSTSIPADTLSAFQSTHSLRSATAPDHIHCYSTAQTILCANLPEKAIIT